MAREMLEMRASFTPKLPQTQSLPSSSFPAQEFKEKQMFPADTLLEGCRLKISSWREIKKSLLIRKKKKKPRQCQLSPSTNHQASNPIFKASRTTFPFPQQILILCGFPAKFSQCNSYLFPHHSVFFFSPFLIFKQSPQKQSFHSQPAHAHLCMEKNQLRGFGCQQSFRENNDKSGKK